MKRIQLTTNLYLDEYIPEALYKQHLDKGSPYYGWGDKYYELLIRKLDPKLVEADQALRDIFGKVMINTWWEGGMHHWSGYRPPWSKTGSVLSDHREGRASDKTFINYPAEEVRAYIKKNWQALGITVLEENVSWVHTSVAWIREQKTLKLVYP